MSIGQELRDLERRGWDALCAGTGDRFYGEIMTEDGLMVLANGQTMDRGEVVASLAASPRWTGYEISGERVVPLGAGAAALVYSALAFRGDEPPFAALMSSVYVREGVDWRLALYQQTPSG